MNLVTISLSAATLIGMAIVLTYVLGWANRAFHVEVDPRVEAIDVALPGANCGGCGYIGCTDYAEAIVGEDIPINKCNVGGDSVAAAIADVMGVEVTETWPFRPIVHCGAHYDDRLGRSEYRGEQSCLPANLVADIQACTYGCLGFGDCASSCDYDAIHVVEGLATVDYEKCIGCGSCAKACPRNIITIAPFKSSQLLAVTCSNKDTGKQVKSVCKVGCLGCKACGKVTDRIKIEDNLPGLDYDDYSDDFLEELTKASEKCPSKRLLFIGMPSAKDLESAAEEEAPEIVTPDFKTTVDDTEWTG